MQLIVVVVLLAVGATVTSAHKYSLDFNHEVDKWLSRACLDPRGCSTNAGPESRERRMAGGTAVSDACATPYSSVVSLSAVGLQLCNGFYTDAGTIRTTKSCFDFLEYTNGGNDVEIIAGDGAALTISSGTISGVDNGDGTCDITLPSTHPSTCLTAAAQYDAATNAVTDVSTCTVASYGGMDASWAGFYDGTLNEAPLVDSPLFSCCDTMLPVLANQPIGGTLNGTAGDFTCAATDAASFCVGDLGSPIFCPDTSSGENVVVGMVVNSECSAGETFVALDFTGSSLTNF